MTFARRTIAALLGLAMLLPAGPGLADEAKRERTKEAPHYESPVLSLLFLPFNLLIRMASVLEPEGRRREETTRDEK